MSQAPHRQASSLLSLLAAAAAGACLFGCAGMPPPPVAARVAPAARLPRPAAKPPSPAKPTPLAFDRVKTTRRVVALTFDCCQTAKPAGYDKRLVSFLTAHKVPATFFLGGRWIEAHPQTTKALAAVPYFELENHSYLHPHMNKLTAAQARQELVKTQQLLTKQAGRPARFFRPPYGEWNKLVLTEAARAGMAIVTWTVVTGDPDRHATVKDLMAAFRKSGPGSIIIMHANGRGWRTADALPQMLAWLQKHNLRPVTLAELVAQGQPGRIQPHR